MPFELYTDDELHLYRYRFVREFINLITNALTDDLQHKTRRSHALQPVDQVLIAPRFFASDSFLQVVGDTIGVDTSTVSRVVMDVARALVAKLSNGGVHVVAEQSSCFAMFVFNLDRETIGSERVKCGDEVPLSPCFVLFENSPTDSPSTGAV